MNSSPTWTERAKYSRRPSDAHARISFVAGLPIRRNAISRHSCTNAVLRTMPIPRRKDLAVEREPKPRAVAAAGRPGLQATFPHTGACRGSVAGATSSPRRLARARWPLGGWDVLVQAEEVVRVVLRLYLDEPLVVRAVSCSDRVIDVVVVEIVDVPAVCPERLESSLGRASTPDVHCHLIPSDR
jgi:hypothetical protein